MSCNNKTCCKHGQCLINGHDIEVVSGPGVSNRCKKCGEFNVLPIELPSFKDASLTQRLAGMYTQEEDEFKGVELPWSD